MERASSFRHGKACGVLDKCFADASLPARWLNEQTVELGIAIVTAQHDAKPNDYPLQLRDECPAALDLFRRKVDRVRMSEQGLAVFFPHQRRSALQLFKDGPLLDRRGTNGDYLFFA
ncbi:MAG TPA: hypothetical protein VKT51_04360 [Candidatus Eremiobacteraceae bacterium]|nr:hypothetical protein [Candidatus Eremiobacteraceae bacterium]